MLRLRELRKVKKVSQVELAQILHCTQNSISRYENGDEPPLSLVKEMAEYFGVSMDYMIGRSEEEAEQHPIVKEVNVNQALLTMMSGLTDSEIQRVKDFIAGMRSGN